MVGNVIDRVFDDPLPKIFFGPAVEKQSEWDYHEQFWKVLEFLHRRDLEPWLTDIPTEPDDPRWEFCFAGEPMFVVGRAPFYTNRKSRYMPYGLEMTIQPRKNSMTFVEI